MRITNVRFQCINIALMTCFAFTSYIRDDPAPFVGCFAGWLAVNIWIIIENRNKAKYNNI